PPPAPLRAGPRPARGAEGLRPPDRGARAARGARARPRARRRRRRPRAARRAGARPRARPARVLPRCDRPPDDARPPAGCRRGRLPVPLRGTAARVPRGARCRAAGGRDGGQRHPGADSRGRDRLPGTAGGPGGARGCARPRRRGPRCRRPPRGARPGAGRAAPPVVTGRPGLPRALRPGRRRATGRGGSMSRRVLVIGLDGATFRTLGPWAARGEMPELARLMAAGCHGELRSTFPPLTPPAWSSFMTGKNPGKHGVFSFRRLAATAYRSGDLITANQLRARTLWDIAGEAGLRVGAINVPPSYPVRPVNGFMVACLMAPAGESDVISPPELRALLPEDYAISLEPPRQLLPSEPGYREQCLAYLEKLRRLGQQRLQVTLRLLREQPWDLLSVVFYEPDRVQHFFWSHLAAAGPAGVAPEVVAEPGSAGVWLNVRGRQPEGRVAPGAEYERVREAIRAGLAALREDGRRVFALVARREDVYQGPHGELAPDLVLYAAPSHGLMFNGLRPELRAHASFAPFVEYGFTGAHEPAGIYVVAGP